MDNPRNLIAQAQVNFHQFAVVEMMLFWVCNSPDPQLTIDTLIAGWRERQRQFAEAKKEAEFKQTGLVDTAGFDLAMTVLDEAEREIRERFSKAQVEHREQVAADILTATSSDQAIGLCCKICGRDATEIPEYIEAAKQDGVSVNRYVYYTNFICPMCVNAGQVPS